jgi:hypothetical protein
MEAAVWFGSLINFPGLYLTVLVWKMPASDILTKSYPAAYENQFIICVIL